MKALLFCGSVLALAYLTGCESNPDFIAGNEEAVAGGIESGGEIASGIVTTLLPPPFNIIVGGAVLGLSTWLAGRIRYNKGVNDMAGVVGAGRNADPNFNATFNDDTSAATVAMKNTLTSNPRLASAFNKTRGKA